jgi:hypothetical protein
MAESQELTELKNISHFIQAGFMAAVAVAQQVRDGKKASPTPDELESAADLLRRCSENLMNSDFPLW